MDAPCSWVCRMPERLLLAAILGLKRLLHMVRLLRSNLFSCLPPSSWACRMGRGTCLYLLLAIAAVTLLLPLAMFAMRGQKKAQSKLAAAAFLTAAISLFSMVAMSLVYASYHQIDYAAAGEPNLPTTCHHVPAFPNIRLASPYSACSAHVLHSYT